MKRVIIVGSPRTAGRSAHLAEMLFEANIDERPEDELFLVPVSEIDVAPCIGCDACRGKIDVTVRDDEGNEVSEQRHRCVFDDDMQMVYDLLDDADTLSVVCPVYFSGAPAPMKCLLDRMQPYFWAYRENGPVLPKRSLELHVVGEGGDPHGYGPLVSEVKAPMALAGFELSRILDWVGKIDREGEIESEAVEVEVPLPLPTGRPKGEGAQALGQPGVRDEADELAGFGAGASCGASEVGFPEAVADAQVDEGADAQAEVALKRANRKPVDFSSRPKLDLTGARGDSKAHSRDGASAGGRRAGKPGASRGKGQAASKDKKAQAGVARSRGANAGKTAEAAGKPAGSRGKGAGKRATGASGPVGGRAAGGKKAPEGKQARNRKGGRRG